MNEGYKKYLGIQYAEYMLKKMTYRERHSIYLLIYLTGFSSKLINMKTRDLLLSVAC